MHVVHAEFWFKVKQLWSETLEIKVNIYSFTKWCQFLLFICKQVISSKAKMEHKFCKSYFHIVQVEFAVLHGKSNP